MSGETAADSGQILRLVSESLRTMIRQHISELASEAAVVFESPAEIEAQGETKLSLYLFQLENNPYLRNLPPSLSHNPGRTDFSLQVTPAPLVVDLQYMFVPYARSAELELVLVDKLVQLFHDRPRLYGADLHPILRASGNENIPIVPEFANFERLHNIWASFPGKAYKLTKLYTLSPVRIPSTNQAQSEMVGSGNLQAEQIPHLLESR